MSDYIVEVFIRTGVLRFRCHLDFYLLFSLDVVHQFAEHEVRVYEAVCRQNANQYAPFRVLRHIARVYLDARKVWHVL